MQRGGWIRFGGTAACLAIAGIAAANPSGWWLKPPNINLNLPTMPNQSFTPQASTTTVPDVSNHPKTWVTILFWVLAIALIALIVVAAVRAIARAVASLRVSRLSQQPKADSLDVGANAPGARLAPAQLLDAVSQALQRLDEAATPHDAVIAAWLAMEEAAAQHGVDRDPTQTPTEFTVELLSRTPAPPQSTNLLLHLYLAARFSKAQTTTGQVAQAREALHAIADALRHPAQRHPAPSHLADGDI